MERNYLEIYPYDKWSDSYLPLFRQGEKFMPTSCEMKEGATSPPELLTEAELISIMDANGIGKHITMKQVLLYVSNVHTDYNLSTLILIVFHKAPMQLFTNISQRYSIDNMQ